MKKAAAVASLLVVLSLALAGAAVAVENSWRFQIMPDDGNGMYSGGAMAVGVYSTASTKDPVIGDNPTSDAQDVRGDYLAFADTTKCIMGVFPLDSAGLNPATWLRDIQSSRPPWEDRYAATGYRKVWNLRVAGMPAADTTTPIRLQFFTYGPQGGVSILPPATLTHPTLGQVAARYYLRMVDNKGKAGAPANGTTWSIPTPTVHSGTAYFTFTLPTIRTTAKAEGYLISEGYVMQFWQEAVPEPSTMLALGAGLIALAGFTRRRRR